MPTWCLKAAPDNAAALSLRGTAYARKRDYGRALADFDKAIGADANDATRFAERGQIYLAKNDSHARSPISIARSSWAPPAPRLTARAP